MTWNYYSITASNGLVGDINGYGEDDLIKFIRSDLTASAVAKPQFVNKVFFPPMLEKNGSDYTASFFNNLSYTSGNLLPWYNNYTDFFSNIRGCSQDHSVIPEFIVSNYDNITVSETPVRYGETFNSFYPFSTTYLNLNGREKYTSTSPELYENIKIDNFIDKKSNKFKLVFSGIKKLLPYNGFYPSQYSQIITKRFADSYFAPNLTSLEKQAMIQPIFGPGAFFNTIKAGIAMSYPVVTFQEGESITTSSIYTTVPTDEEGHADELFISASCLNKKFTFDDLLNPVPFFNENEVFAYTDPTRYNKYYFDSETKHIIPIFSGSKIVKNNFDTYKLTINNFLAETVDFFLKNNELTSFVSAPESEFNIPTGQNDYGLKIKITKNNNFSMFSKKTIKQLNSKICEESLFGPPVDDEDYQYYLEDTPSYNYYSPVYMPGHATASYTPGESDSVLTIFCRDLPSGSRPTVQNLLDNLWIGTGSINGNVGGVKYNHYVGLRNGTISYAVNTFLDSLLLKQKISVKQNTIDPTTGEAISSTDSKDAYRWSIQTKFETPLIDYSDYQTIDTNYDYYQDSDYITISSSTYATSSARAVINNQSINGIWNTIGTIPSDGQSIDIELYDDLFGNFSLFNLCGFKKETKSIGQLANQKEIGEAVIVLPYCKSNINSNMSKVNSDEPNKWFISIGADKINKALSVPDYTKININKIKNILDTSSKIDPNNVIVKLMKTMIKYNIPPHLNWLKDKAIKPFVMYIAEFNHVLDKQDLADIWQGNMPKIAQIPEQQQVVIEHTLDSDNFYDRATLDKYIAAGMYIKVFKVKQRGKMAYSEITAGAEDDAKFNTDFPDKWYSYNWPYDYFSLVELLNIKAGEVYENTGSV